jgi:hypothetical protein
MRDQAFIAEQRENPSQAGGDHPRMKTIYRRGGASVAAIAVPVYWPFAATVLRPQARRGSGPAQLVPVHRARPAAASPSTVPPAIHPHGAFGAGIAKPW